MIKTIPRSAQSSASTVFGVRVSCGHLCEAEAPTEAAAETVARTKNSLPGVWGGGAGIRLGGVVAD